VHACDVFEIFRRSNSSTLSDNDSHYTAGKQENDWHVSVFVVPLVEAPVAVEMLAFGFCADATHSTMRTSPDPPNPRGADY
jgi:hypothetical protein